MFEHLYQQYWIELPKDVRFHLAKVFGLVKTGITEIRDQTVVSDGFTNKDLEGISFPAMAEYVGETNDTKVTFHRLWELTLAKVNSELHPPINLNPVIIPRTEPRETPEVNSSLLIEAPKEIIKEIVKPFCDTCDSKGGRHMKSCPLFK